jgi:HEAT repeat protein
VPRHEPGEPTEEERERHAWLMTALLRSDGAVPKLQRRLETLEHLWRPFMSGYTIRMSRVRRRGITPAADEVAGVARFIGHPSREVRRTVLELLRHARGNLDAALPAVCAGLGDPEMMVRIAAVRAAWQLGAGERLEAELTALLESPTWKLRWYAAAALAATPQRERAAEVFAASFPARANAACGGQRIHVRLWVELAGAFTPTPPAIAALLATAGALR